jgi:hypothetical protein
MVLASFVMPLYADAVQSLESWSESWTVRFLMTKSCPGIEQNNGFLLRKEAICVAFHLLECLCAITSIVLENRFERPTG